MNATVRLTMMLKAAIFLLTVCDVMGQTNTLWFLPFNAPTNAVSIETLCSMIERQSLTQAPQTRGVRVVLAHVGSYRLEDLAPVKFTGTNATLLAAVQACAYITSTEIRLADDIALLLPTTEPYRYVIVAVDGRCEDAASGEPISGIRIKPEWPYEALMYVNTNGYFACGIPKRFLFWSQAGALVQTEKEFPRTVAFTLSAPGYEAKVVTNCFYQDYCGWHGQTFKLKREEGSTNKVPEDTARELADPQH